MSRYVRREPAVRRSGSRATSCCRRRWTSLARQPVTTRQEQRNACPASSTAPGLDEVKSLSRPKAPRVIVLRPRRPADRHDAHRGPSGAHHPVARARRATTGRSAWRTARPALCLQPRETTRLPAISGPAVGRDGLARDDLAQHAIDDAAWKTRSEHQSTDGLGAALQGHTWPS